MLLMSLLTGCAESRMYLRGNAPFAYWVANHATRLHGDLICNLGNGREQRAARISNTNGDVWVDVQHRCALGMTKSERGHHEQSDYHTHKVLR